MADQTQHKLHWRPIAAGIAILVVVYLLGCGPALWLFTNDYFPQLPLMEIYDPIWWLSTKVEWFNDVLSWYASFWGIG